MISLVICSKKPKIADELVKNINNTIGLDYEIIVVLDRDSEHSIFSAYNKGIKQSKFDFVCFIHDDIFFHSNDWGKTIVQHLMDDHDGFIGIAGGTMLPRVPAPWSFGPHFKHFIQSEKHSKKTEFHYLGDFDEKHYKSVVFLDGVFLACKKELFNNLSFDEKSYHGFHCYDQDICMQASVLGFENRVIDNILIEHFSRGNFTKSWIESELIFWRKWRTQSTVNMSQIELKKLAKRERKYLKFNFAKKMARTGFTNREITQIFYEYNNQIVLSENGKLIHNNPFHLFWIRIIHCPTSLISHLSSPQ
jgi:hypothetical protein